MMFLPEYSIIKVMKKFKRPLLIILAVLLLICAEGLIYVSVYYRADEAALAALASDETVTVTQTGYGWYFDGPSEDEALVFYPGGKVEETAYAPLLHSLAGRGLDVCLVSMPFRLAVNGRNKALDVVAQYDYKTWYIGGHSLGGVIGAICAADHDGLFAGVIALASYPAKPLEEDASLLCIYGSEDSVMRMKVFEKSMQYAPKNTSVHVIEGGNHAQFGNYGSQYGDGESLISAEEQQAQTVDLIMQSLRDRGADK